MYDDNNKPKAVAFFSPGWPPGHVTNGIVTYVGNLSNVFALQGRKSYIISDNLEKLSVDSPHMNLAELPVNVVQRMIGKISLLLPPHNDLSLILSAMKIAKGFKILSALYPCNLLEMEESFGIVWYVQKLIRVPIVVRLHGPWFLSGTAQGVPRDDHYFRKNFAERRAISAAVGVTSPSQDVLDAVRHEHNLPLTNAIVIPNPTPIIPIERRWTQAGSKHRTILFVGRFDRTKGGDLMVDAFELIAKKYPESRLIFVGPDIVTGLRINSGKIYHLTDYIRDRISPEFQEHIEVMGKLKAHEIEPLRREASVTVMASRYENFSLALLEALSWGCPTVASAVGGNPEILIDRKTGLLFKPNDHVSLAEKVIELLCKPKLAAELGQTAAEDIAKRFSPQKVADLTWEYYEKILNQTIKKNRNPFRF